MKVALCLSGHLRTFRATYGSLLQNIIEPLGCDVFLHTWDVISAPTTKNGQDITHRSLKTMDYIEDIKKLYNPVFFQIEDEQQWLAETRPKTHGIKIKAQDIKFIADEVVFHLSMFYSVYMANQLRKEYESDNDIKYDLIIRCRPDIHFHHKLDLNSFKKQNCIYVPKIATYDRNGMNDQVAVASPHIMDIYCDAHLSVLDYYKTGCCTPRPERLYKFHMDKNKIPVHHIDINYDIYRLGGYILQQKQFDCEISPDKNFLHRR